MEKSKVEIIQNKLEINKQKNLSLKKDIIVKIAPYIENIHAIIFIFLIFILTKIIIYYLVIVTFRPFQDRS